jgi:methylthioribose-1-phosphate isomerase
MKVGGQHFRTIWLHPTNERVVQLIDQRALPHRFVVEDVSTVEQMADAIRQMHVRGAGLIGASAGYGMYLAAIEASPSRIGSISAKEFDARLTEAAERLKATRPTAVNLAWAIERVRAGLAGKQTLAVQEKVKLALCIAKQIAAEDEENCRMIGQHGLNLIEEIARTKNGKQINVLTHCNAGWLATVDWGTATAPIYLAHDRGLKVHVWVDETRPRNQGASLTAWELGHHGVPHTVIPDNTGGHLMQHRMVDLAIVGTDRVTANGDVCNKIGTYLKALAAHDNGVPFYVALPSPTIDFGIDDGIRQIPIEQRSADEVATMTGRTADGRVETVRVVPDGSPVANYAFDVTPARLVTGLITERGLLRPERAALASAFPERSAGH